MKIGISEKDYEGYGINKILPFSKLAHFAFTNQIGILNILEHVKAKDWPRKEKHLVNDQRFTVPLIWGILSAASESILQLEYDIHPGKCFPNLYNRGNEHSKNYKMPKISDSTNAGGCARTSVTIQDNMYLVADLIPRFCSVFGLPDDCYSPCFEERMLSVIKTYKPYEMWCYKKTEYIDKKVCPIINLHYLQEEILPKKYFQYIDASENYLKGILPVSELEALRKNSWYEDGSEFITEMDPGNINGYYNEDNAEVSIIKNLLFESIRLLLIRINSAAYASFVPKELPPLNYELMKDVNARVDSLIESVRINAEIDIQRLLKSINNRLDWALLRRVPFIIMDMEYLHVLYPTAADRQFNFPCIFANIVVLNESDISLVLFVTKLPCYYCNSYPCTTIKKTGSLNFDCLCINRAVIDEYLAFLESMMASYENLRVFTYGKSDFVEIEHAYNFFSDETEHLRFLRKNRVRAKRVIDLCTDLSINGKNLSEMENVVISKWLLNWKRAHQKVDVNPRFITSFSSGSWDERFKEALLIPIDDAISALLLFLFSRDSTDKTPREYLEQTDVDGFC